MKQRHLGADRLAFAALSDAPMVAKSVAAEDNTSGTANTNDTSHLF